MEHLDKKEDADHIGDTSEKVERSVTGGDGAQRGISEQDAEPFTQITPETGLLLWHWRHLMHANLPERTGRNEKRARIPKERQGCAHQLDQPPCQTWPGQVRQ